MKTNRFKHLYCYCLYTVKWFQLLLSNHIILVNNNHEIAGVKWLQVLQFNTNYFAVHSFAHSQMIPSIAMLYQYFNSGTQLKSFKYCYLPLIILFNITHLFTHS